MAELLQLDAAAALIGKSEVTLRRLIKAGKIPFQKEKTLTGFIYRVNPDDVRAYYKMRDVDGVVDDALPEMEAEPVVIEQSSQKSPGIVRVAVATETGSAADYWQRRAEVYEERYHQEVAKHSQTREDLGVWRGRAEQSQAMLVKLLPAPSEVETQASAQVAKQAAHHEEKDAAPTWLVSAFVTLLILILAGGGVLLYLHPWR